MRCVNLLKIMKLIEEFRRKFPNMTVPEITFTQSKLFTLALLKSEDDEAGDTGNAMIVLTTSHLVDHLQGAI